MIPAYDAKKIIDALKYCAYGERSCDKCPVGKDCKGMTNKAMTLAIEWIETEATKKQPHWIDNWISVKDRLPTSIVNKVLVWLEHKDLNGYLGFGHYEKYKGQEIWYDLEHNEAFSIRGYAVTHWMPLPEPPKEEN